MSKLIPNKPLIKAASRLKSKIGPLKPKYRGAPTYRGFPPSIRRAFRNKFYFFLTKDQVG